MTNKLFNRIDLPGVGPCYVKGFLPKGYWQAGVTYPFSSLVRLGKSSFICINPDGSNNSPLTLFVTGDGQYLCFENGEYVVASSNVDPDWQELCRDGEDGESPDVITDPSQPTYTVYDADTEFRVGNESSYISIGRTTANQNYNLKIYIPYASLNKPGAMSTTDYQRLTELWQNMFQYAKTSEVIAKFNEVVALLDNYATKEYVGNALLEIQVNGKKITPTGGDFTANKNGDKSVYNITVPVEETLKDNIENTLRGEFVTHTNLNDAVAAEMADTTGSFNHKESKDRLSFIFTESANAELAGQATIMDVNYTKVGDSTYRVNIKGSIFCDGSFSWSNINKNYNYPVCIYQVSNNQISDISGHDTIAGNSGSKGMVYFLNYEHMLEADHYTGVCMFEIGVFVGEKPTNLNDGLYGTLYIHPFYK